MQIAKSERSCDNESKCCAVKIVEKDVEINVGLLVVLGLWPFETVFQSISGRLPKRGRKRKKG